MFNLRYSPRARRELATAWIAAPPGERNAVTRAAHEIDELLRREGDTAGESRSGPYRICFVEPLAVYYRLERDGTTLTVTRVWSTR